MEFSKQPILFTYPVFVVLKVLPNRIKKGRIIIDIRGLNVITESDSYLLPL